MRKFFLRRKTSKRAFTLLELLAVLTILGIIIGVVAPAIMKQVRKARIEAAKVQLHALEESLNSFNLACGYYPSTEQGLDALLNAPQVGKTCKGYPPGGFWDKNKLPNDPWKNPYRYFNPGTRNPSGYDLFSAGPDGADDTDDDIRAWEQ